MKVSMIAIIGKNRELGKDGHLLFNIKDDMKRFRETTRGHVIIMGRKTFESIGRLLPNRINIIITRDPNYKVEGAIVVSSIQEALRQAQGDNEDLFIIGGGQIYEQALPYTDKLYLTVVDKTVDADTFFPDYSMFTKVIFEEEHEEGGFKYKFITLER